MRRFSMLFVILLLAGCGGQTAAPQVPNITPPASPVVATRAVREIHIQNHAGPDAEPGGRVWLDVGSEQNIPVEAWDQWRVGITDSAGHSQVLGRLSRNSVDRGHFSYVLPEDLSPGTGSVWLSTGDDPAASGTVEGPILLQPFRLVLDSQTLGIRFNVPRGWRLSEASDGITMSNGPERPAQPVEEIDIAKGLVKWTPDRSKVEKTESTTVAGYPATRMYVSQRSANDSAFWSETHTIVHGIDITLRYRPELTTEMTDAYNLILQSLSFK